MEKRRANGKIKTNVFVKIAAHHLSNHLHFEIHFPVAFFLTSCDDGAVLCWNNAHDTTGFEND